MGTLQKLENSNIVVVGCARNCTKSIARQIDIINRSLQSAKAVKWLVVESDSSDNTVATLSKITNKIPDFNFITLGTLREKVPLRTERIAICRNIYLEEIKENILYKDIDYVIVADFDGINSNLNSQAVKSCWTRDNWDVCTANQPSGYYDIWALRHKLWSPNDCFEQYQFYVDTGSSYFRAYFTAIFSRMIKIPPKSDWIEVDSAFGGFAIYKLAAFKISKYSGITTRDKEVCEHVKFHTDMRARGYNIYINPSLVNAKYTEHSFKALIKIILLFSLSIFNLNILWKILKGKT